MREDFVAGNLGYDPLNLCPFTDDGFLKRRTQELNNGRMAMIATALILVQERLTGLTVSELVFGKAS